MYFFSLHMGRQFGLEHSDFSRDRTEQRMVIEDGAAA
jgi:hypothetical protein